MDKDLIALRFRQLPVRLHLTSKAFAEKLGIAPQVLARYQNGENTPPATLLIKVKSLFNVDMNWFCDVTLKDNVVTKQIICKYKECYYCGA